MEGGIWTSTIISLAVSLIAGIAQLLIEYHIIQPALRKSVSDQPAQTQQLDRPLKQPRLANLEYSYLGLARVLVTIILTFGSVSMAARVGYELGGSLGIVGGIVVGLILTLMAMWAIYTWSTKLAKAASTLALAGLVTLVVAGLFTLVAKLVGIPIEFSGGLLAVSLGVLFIIVLAVLLIASAILGPLGVALSGSGATKPTDEGPLPVEPGSLVDTLLSEQSSREEKALGNLLYGQPTTGKDSSIEDLLREGSEDWARGESED